MVFNSLQINKAMKIIPVKPIYTKNSTHKKFPLLSHNPNLIIKKLNVQ